LAGLWDCFCIMWFTHYSQLGLLKGASGGSTTLTSQDLASIRDIVWDETVDDGYTARQLMRLMAAVLLGKNTGLGQNGGQPIYRSLGDIKNRVSGTVDKYGNRLDTTLDGT